MADTGEKRYNIKESLNRILRTLQGAISPEDNPDTLSGEIRSVDEALSDLAELIENRDPNNSFTVPSNGATNGQVLLADGNGLSTWGNTVTGFTEYAADISQTGTANPNLDEIFDGFGVTCLGVRDAQGEYTFTFSSAILTAGKTQILLTMNSDTFQLDYAAVFRTADNTFELHNFVTLGKADTWGYTMLVRVYN